MPFIDQWGPASSLSSAAYPLSRRGLHSSNCSDIDSYTLWEELSRHRQAEITRGEIDAIELSSRTPSPFALANETLDWTPWVTRDLNGYIGHGTFGDVFKGSWRNLPDNLSPPQVALKRMRVRQGPLGPEDRQSRVSRGGVVMSGQFNQTC